MSQAASHLTFPRVERSALRHEPQREWTRFADAAGEIRLRPRDRLTQPRGIVFAGRLLGEAFQLLADPTELSPFAQALAPLSDEIELDPPLAAGIVELLLVRFFLPRLSAAGQATFAFEGAAKHQSSLESSQWFDLEWSELKCRFAVMAGPRVGALLREIVTRIPQRVNDLRRIVPLRGEIEIARYTLGLPLLQSLLPGDTIVTEATFRQADGFCHLVIGPASTWLARRAPDFVTIVGPASAPNFQETFMPDDVIDESIDVTGLSEVPLVLQFLAGRVEATVREFETMQPGQVLSTPGRPAGEVDMVINGRRIGRAELVDVEGSAGFRIIEIAGRQNSD